MIDSECARLYASREAYKRCLASTEAELQSERNQNELLNDHLYAALMDCNRLRATLAAVSEEARADTEALHDQIDSLKNTLEETRDRMRVAQLEERGKRIAEERAYKRLCFEK